MSNSEEEGINVLEESVRECESGVRVRIRLGSVTIRLIYMGNLFVINKIFTWVTHVPILKILRTLILQLKSLVIRRV